MAVFEPIHFRSDPTPEVIAHAQSTIRTHEQAIDNIEAHIQALLAEARILRAEQAAHRTHISRCKGVLTLARRLPEELLIKIFEHCVVDGWTRAPIVVSHVCSTWRSAAQAPKVWSHVYIQCDDPVALDRTRFWLNMAQQSKLHITIVASWRTHRTVLTNVVALLSLRADQWRSITVDTDVCWQAERLVAECKAAAPHLREISIRTTVMTIPTLDALGAHDFDVSDIVSLPDRFDEARAPLLDTLSYTADVLPAVPVFPAHIQHLTLNVPSSPGGRPLSAMGIVTILENLPALRTLSFSMPTDPEHLFAPELDFSRTASLPHLTSLTLHGPADLNGFLAHLHAPALRILALRSLEDSGYRQDPLGPTLMEFLAASAPPLESLELHDIDLTQECFAACFAALPDLRELRLHESAIADGTIALLCVREGGQGLCPRLRKLDLRWCGHLHGSALVKLVKSRKAADDGVVDPMEEVAVINCCFVREEDVLELARHAVCRLVMRDREDYCRKPFNIRAIGTMAEE